MYSNKEVLPFDGTMTALIDQLNLVQATMPRCPAFVLDSTGEILNGLRITVKSLSDGSHVWDVELFHRKAE
jgi:hypothetical protein